MTTEKQPMASKNNFTTGQAERLKSILFNTCFNYQLDWYRAGSQRTRVILKSRQIGATFYFAREALLDAMITGRNQFFMAASESQAGLFRENILDFAAEVGLALEGNPLALSNGATLHFIGPETPLLSEWCGNIYFDEFFWTLNFDSLDKAASSISAHNKYRKTYFSSLLRGSSEAYSLWAGVCRGESLEKEDLSKADARSSDLRGGQVCEENIWRQIVTIQDAVDAGNNLLDIDLLRQEFSSDQFLELFMCDFRETV